MSLQPGARLGPYEVVALLGAGGMGEVYRGRDPRLARDIAIKVLPASVTADPDRLHRFELEAKAAAALNHPNILAVYDIGQHNGSPYIVSELLEGQTLRAHLTMASAVAHPAGQHPSQRRLPARKAVDYALQMVRGLSAAHDKRITHRDLKPENVFLTTDGQLKILDFGLAKLAEPAAASIDAQAPTVGGATSPGVVLGTLGYMSPEQVRGQTADHRSDIFAFGATFYEMLSGHRAFDGESGADTMTAILNEHPAALSGTDPELAPGLARIVERCLEKSPAARFQSTHDLGFALEGLSTHSGVSKQSNVTQRPSVRWLPWAVAAVVTFLLVAVSILATRSNGRPEEALTPVRFQIPPPPEAAFSYTAIANSIAISADGRHVAFSATNASGTPMIWLRTMDSVDAQPLPGTEDGRQPFWSPDSRFIGFFAAGTLKKVPLGGGRPQTVCEASLVPTGGAWNADGVILYSNLSGPIRRVAATGGQPQPATVHGPDRLSVEEIHSFPHFLPDGKRFLYYVRSPNPETSGIYVKSLDSDDARRVMSASSNVAFAKPGYILYARDGVLVAQPFNPDRVETTGEPVTVAEHVDQFPESGVAAFSASQSGVLMYRATREAAVSRLRWVDRAGKPLGDVGEARPYRNPRLSPDGKRVAVEIVDRSGNRDIWLLDVTRGVPARFTFDQGRDAAPVWSGDGQTIFWQGNSAMYKRSSTGSGPPEAMRDEPWIPDDSLPGGNGLLAHPIAPRQIWLFPFTGTDRAPRPVVEGRLITTHARVSPDARWIAFGNTDSGRFEIYLQNFSNPSGRWPVSTDGGIQPKWRRDGKELFYLALDGTLMSVSVTLDALAEIGKPQPLFPTRMEATSGFTWHQYDVTPDGQRFLVNMPEAVTSPLTLVINWPGLLKQ